MRRKQTHVAMKRALKMGLGEGRQWEHGTSEIDIVKNGQKSLDC
jgi:hypothetical protein